MLGWNRELDFSKPQQGCERRPTCGVCGGVSAIGVVAGDVEQHHRRGRPTGCVMLDGLFSNEVGDRPSCSAIIVFCSIRHS